MPYGKDTQMAYFEAQTHLLKGDLQDAYIQLMTCVEAEPDEYAFHYQLGKIDHDLERYDEAEERLTRAAELAPANTWVLYHRGLARLAQGNGAGAEQDSTPLWWTDPAIWKRCSNAPTCCFQKGTSCPP